MNILYKIELEGYGFQQDESTTVYSLCNEFVSELDVIEKACNDCTHTGDNGAICTWLPKKSKISKRFEVSTSKKNKAISLFEISEEYDRIAWYKRQIKNSESNIKKLKTLIDNP